MKFLFCGNLPCPEWFMAESAVLSKITAIKMKLVVGHIISKLLDDTEVTDKIYKLLDGSGFNLNEMNAVVSTLQFVIRNSVMYSITDAILTKELVDLGIPRENVQSIAKTYKQHRDRLLEKYSNQFFRISSQPRLQYSVNELITCQSCPDAMTGMNLPTRYADVSLKYRDVAREEQSCSFVLTSIRLDELVSELEKAYEIMTELDHGGD